MRFAIRNLGKKPIVLSLSPGRLLELAPGTFETVIGDKIVEIRTGTLDDMRASVGQCGSTAEET